MFYLALILSFLLNAGCSTIKSGDEVFLMALCEKWEKVDKEVTRDGVKKIEKVDSCTKTGDLKIYSSDEKQLLRGYGWAVYAFGGL